ncbi:hypothetical protein L0Y59_01395, partial [Candidatus Uhrbacteria bacterium]|nr:hypothetical protein [Candidatus Uhrbacteria bacterium]
MEQIRNPFVLPPVESGPSSDPKRREKRLLERAAKGPAGRWMVAAMLALSSQGCASFRLGAGMSLLDREREYPGYDEEPSAEAQRRMEEESRGWEESPSARRAGKKPSMAVGDAIDAVTATLSGEGRMGGGLEPTFGVESSEGKRG